MSPPTNSDGIISPKKFSLGTSEREGCFINVTPTTIKEGSFCQGDGNTVTFKNFTNTGRHDKPSKPLRPSVGLPDSFSEIEIHDLPMGGRRRSKTMCSIDLHNDFVQPAILREYSGTSGSQLGSGSKQARDDHGLSPVSQLRRAKSVLIQEPNHNCRQKDIFGNLLPGFIPKTHTE